MTRLLPWAALLALAAGPLRTDAVAVIAGAALGLIVLRGLAGALRTTERATP